MTGTGLLVLSIGSWPKRPFPKELPVSVNREDQETSVRVFDPARGTVIPVDRLELPESAWQDRLSPEAFRVLRQAGTEMPGSGRFDQFDEPGTFRCSGCGLPLFASEDKFDAGCGWPSFSRPLAAENVAYRPDASHGMNRTETRCPRCGGHLGHVFPDGPGPAGLRYCINSAALTFEPSSASAPVQDREGPQQATFGAGCFWGVEEAFRTLPGVLTTAVGFMGGVTVAPTYRQVCAGDTGHAEVVQLTYDPVRISYRRLLETFFSIHDPTTPDRQGPDVGPQYRSVIFTATPTQRQEAQAMLAELAAAKRFRHPVVTEVRPAGPFTRAEEYHQRYLEKRGQASCGTR